MRRKSKKFWECRRERVVDVMALPGRCDRHHSWGAPGIGDKGSVEIIKRFWDGGARRWNHCGGS